MKKELKMIRKASDNKYLHKDFHILLSIGLNYVQKQYGDEAVREYIRQFALAYYAPLKERIHKKGLDAIEAHFKEVYEKEEWAGHVSFTRLGKRLTVSIDECPGVSHIKKSGGQVSPLYLETTKTLYEIICKDTGFEFELISYDERSGKAEFVFNSGKVRV
jgi:acyl-CoA hydrolase